MSSHAQANHTRLVGLVAAIGAVLCISPAGAHHSYSAFDKAHVATLSGTLKQFQWTNPHSWIVLTVPDGKGGEQEWTLEGGAVNALLRRGWTMKTLQPGMKVKLLIAPRRDGTFGGSWTDVLELDGKPFASPAQ